MEMTDIFHVGAPLDETLLSLDKIA